MTHRFKNVDWSLPTAANGNITTWEHVKIALLMDIRDELQKLNRTFDCPNFLEIPAILRVIRANTKKPARKRAKKAKVSK